MHVRGWPALVRRG